jgi:hypothetical protein
MKVTPTEITTGNSGNGNSDILKCGVAEILKWRFNNRSGRWAPSVLVRISLGDSLIDDDEDKEEEEQARKASIPWLAVIFISLATS